MVPAYKIVSNNVLTSIKKIGFNAPFFDLIDIKDPKVRSLIFDNSKVFEIINKKKIEQLFKTKNLKNSYSKFLFNFLNIKLFMENY